MLLPRLNKRDESLRIVSMKIEVLYVSFFCKRDTFAKWIMDEKGISFDSIKDIICFFDDEAKKMYRI